MTDNNSMTKEERQEMRFIKKETMTCAKYLRRMEELGGMPEAMQPFLDTLRTVYVDMENPLNPFQQKMVGTFCVMAPQELVYAAGAIPVKLCSGNYTAFSIGDDPIMHFHDAESVYLIGRVTGILDPKQVATAQDIDKYQMLHPEGI